MIKLIYDNLWKQLDFEDQVRMKPWIDSMARGVMVHLKQTKGSAEVGRLNWPDFKDYNRIMKREKENFVDAIEMKIVQQKNALFAMKKV